MEEIKYRNMQTDFFELETIETEQKEEEGQKSRRISRLEDCLNRSQAKQEPILESIDIRKMQGSVYLGRIGVDGPERTASEFSATSSRCLSEAILKRLRRGFLKTKNYHQVFMLKSQVLLEVLTDLVLHYDQSLENLIAKLTGISNTVFSQLEALNTAELQWEAGSKIGQGDHCDGGVHAMVQGGFFEARTIITLTFAKLVEFKETLSSLKGQVEQKLKQLSSNNKFFLVLEHIRAFFEQYQNAHTRVYRMVQQKADLGSLHTDEKNLFFMESRSVFYMKEFRLNMDRGLIMSIFEYQAAIRAVLSSFSDTIAVGYAKLVECLSTLAPQVPAVAQFLSLTKRTFVPPDLRCNPLEFLRPRVRSYIKKKLEIAKTICLEEADLADFFHFAEIKHSTLSSYVVLAELVCKRAEERNKKNFLLLVDVLGVDCRCSGTLCCASPFSSRSSFALPKIQTTSRSTSSQNTSCVSRSARYRSSSRRRKVEFLLSCWARTGGLKSHSRSILPWTETSRSFSSTSSPFSTHITPTSTPSPKNRSYAA